MIVIDLQIMEEFRQPGPCEFSRVWCTRKEPHHFHGRGLAGAQRLDICINLMGLSMLAHRMFHDGHIPRNVLRDIIAKREGIADPEAMDDLIVRIRNAPKGSMSKAEIQKAIQELRQV